MFSREYSENSVAARFTVIIMLFFKYATGPQGWEGGESDDLSQETCPA